MKNKLKRIAIKLGYYSQPDFLIIGAQKAGTSALHSILQQHSFITSSTKKEIHYFDNDQWFFKNNSLEEYHYFFPLPHRVPHKNILFEATPVYLYHPKVAKRLYEYNADLKLIIILRDPAYRALSAWTMYHHHFKEKKYSYMHDTRSFKEAIEEELSNIDDVNFYNNKNAYVKRGIYYYQIEKLFNYFQRDKILILESNQLKMQFHNSLEVICSFLGIPNQILEPKTVNQSKVDNKNLYVDQIKMLKEFYRPYNSLLFELLGQKYDWDIL